jgi:hypothetical protein
MYLILPDGAKPSKCVSRDETRPALCRAELVETESGKWEIRATDSYRLVKVPLELKAEFDDAEQPVIMAGPIGVDAMRAIEARSARAFRATEDMIEPVAKLTGVALGVLYRRGVKLESLRFGKFPHEQFEAILAGPHSDEFTFGINAQLLHTTLEAIGDSPGRYRNHAAKLSFRLTKDGKPDPQNSIRIHLQGSDADGLIMPVRIDV